MAAEGVKEILQRAIITEEDSYTLYTSASKRIKDPAVRAGLEDLASQEKQHKAKLEALLAGKLAWATKHCHGHLHTQDWRQRNQVCALLHHQFAQ